MDANLQIALNRIQKAKDKHIKELDLSNLQLTQLPDLLVQVRHLEHLYLRNNRLTSLHSDIGKLSHLKILDVGKNQLKMLPKSIRQMGHLEELHLDQNRLNALPREIGLLNQVKRLYLQKNTLNNLPRGIRQMEHLEELHLGFNTLARIPRSIQQLCNLKKLWINNNKVGGLPKELGCLENLEILDLEHNLLFSLPDELGRLTKLKEFYIGNNHLGSIPTIIGNLKKLERIDLSNNEISSLPLEIAYLKKLTSNDVVDTWEKGLRLRGNRFQIPDEVYNREPEEIIQYVLDLQASEKRKPLREAKILFIGSGYVGKTSLINMITQGRYNPDEQKTDGIQIKNWELKRGRDTIKLHVWDFGGQEIMHATHKFFMTPRSVYVLVINPRSEDNYGDSELEYWLKLIRSYAGDVPVVIVINKCETHKINLSRGELRDKYPNIVGFVESSCHRNIGLNQLKQKIRKAVLSLDHIDDVLPESYFKIKEQLEKANADYLSYEKYQEICLKVNPKFQERSMQTLVGLLHDLGVMLNFNEDRRLKDTQVLNPEWVTQGVYQIITSPRLIKKKGIITAREIGNILDTRLYPSRKEHSFIMDMMDRFDLCYQVPDMRDTYFVPGAFPKDRPDILWNFESNKMLRFQYHYDVLPSSIMSKFIVKVHDYIREKDYWRNGVVISKNKCLAYINSDLEDRKIYIRIAGDGIKRELLGFVRAQFDMVHAKISKIDVKSEIPVDKEGKIVLDYEDLLFYEEIGEQNIPVRSLRTKVNVKKLLNGISSETERAEMRKRSERTDDLMPSAEVSNPDLISIPSPLKPTFPVSSLPSYLHFDRKNAKWHHWVLVGLTILVSIIGVLAAIGDATELIERIWDAWE